MRQLYSDRIESFCVITFLVLMILVTGSVFKDLADADIKGQVKSIVLYNHGIKSNK